MKIEQFTRIIWDTLVTQDENKQNHFRVTPEYIQEWSMHSPEFFFMRKFHEFNQCNLGVVRDSEHKKYKQGKLKILKFRAYGRTFGYGIYHIGNTQYLIMSRQDMINIYDHFVDDAQQKKVNKYGEKLATTRRPYFMERFKQTENFNQWMNDPNRRKIF